MASYAGWDMSKWRRGGLHQPPPASPDSAQLGGQRLVAVTVTEAAPGLHHRDRRASQAMAKHAPHMVPLLNSAVLSAVVRVPYPCSNRLPYPHAPPAHACIRYDRRVNSSGMHMVPFVVSSHAVNNKRLLSLA